MKEKGRGSAWLHMFGLIPLSYVILQDQCARWELELIPCIKECVC